MGGSYANVYMSQVVDNDNKTEAVVDFVDMDGYGDRSFVNANESRNFEVVEVRRNYEVTPIRGGMVYAGIIQDFDIVRARGNILDIEFIDEYELSLKDQVVINNDSVWVIRYALNNPNIASTGDAYCNKYEGIIYVRQDDFVILRNELEFVTKGFFHAGRDAYRNVDESTAKYTCRVITDYKESSSGKYALSKISYSGKSQDKSLDIQWVVYDIGDIVKEVDKTFYTDKTENIQFWKRFSIPE